MNEIAQIFLTDNGCSCKGRWCEHSLVLCHCIVPMFMPSRPIGQALAKSFGAQPPASSLARNNFQQFEHTLSIIKLRPPFLPISLHIGYTESTHRCESRPRPSLNLLRNRSVWTSQTYVSPQPLSRCDLGAQKLCATTSPLRICC